MPDRLRAILDRPLDVRVAQAVLVLASAVFLGFGAVALVAVGTGDDRGPSTFVQSAATPSISPSRPDRHRKDAAPVEVRPQDPQDDPGSAPARAAQRELRDHRALQHVPYRRAGVSIELVGSRRGRALLRVRGGDLAAARRGWRRFLDRFDDDGGSYLPIFESGGHDG